MHQDFHKNMKLQTCDMFFLLTAAPEFFSLCGLTHFARSRYDYNLENVFRVEGLGTE